VFGAKVFVNLVSRDVLHQEYITFICRGEGEATTRESLRRLTDRRCRFVLEPVPLHRPTGPRPFMGSLWGDDPLRSSARRTAASQRLVFLYAEEGNRTPQIPRKHLRIRAPDGAGTGADSHELCTGTQFPLSLGAGLVDAAARAGLPGISHSPGGA